MARLLPVLLVTSLALSLPPLAQGLSSNWWAWLWGGDVDTTLAPGRATIGPGCVDGDMQYPGIPSDVASQCPATDPPEPVIITNEYDCSSYFLCEEGVAELICCPSGLLYDPPMLTCDDPPHVVCGSRPILPPLDITTTTAATTVTTTEAPPTTTVTTTEAPPTTTTVPGPTTTPDGPTTTAGPITTTVPATTAGPTTTPGTTAATTTKPTVTTTPPPPPIDSKCDDLPGYFGNLPVDGDCTAYYECDGTVTSEGTIYYCDVGEYGQMVYNPTTQQCDDQWHYPCEDHMIHTV